MSDKVEVGNEGRKMTCPSHRLIIICFLQFQGSCVWRSVMWILNVSITMLKAERDHI